MTCPSSRSSASLREPERLVQCAGDVLLQAIANDSRDVTGVARAHTLIARHPEAGKALPDSVIEKLEEAWVLRRNNPPGCSPANYGCNVGNIAKHRTRSAGPLGMNPDRRSSRSPR